MKPRVVGSVLGLIALLSISLLLWQAYRFRPEKLIAGKFPEQLVYVRSNDDIVNGGAIFAPPRNSAKAIAVVWIHGWGENFYYPTYVAIGRALAEHGYTTIKWADSLSSAER